MGERTQKSQPEGKDTTQTEPRRENSQERNNAVFSGGLLLNLQRNYGNQAVQRLVQQRRPRNGALLPLSASNAAIQLLRNGSLGGVQYDESPEDVITIRISNQVGSLEAILAGVNRVIQTAFGSRRRDYAHTGTFQADLQGFLRSINHPSVGGGPAATAGGPLLQFRVQLQRGEGDRIDSIAFIEPVTTIEVETPEVVEAGAETGAESAAEAPGGQAETGPPEGREPAPASPVASQAETAGQEGPAAEGLASRIAGGLEWLGNLSSARWLWDPITNQIGEWEAELDRIGERREGGVAGQIMLVPVTLLFTILSSIVGMLDLIARLNPTNLALQGVATGIRAASGQYSREEFLRDAEAVGEEALDIITLGLRNAYAHLREGIREANVFRITQAVGEVALAALAIFGIVRGVRARLAARRAAAAAEAEGLRPTEPGPEFAERPTEPGRGFGERTTEPGADFGERPTEPGRGFGERPTEPGRGIGERPTEPGADFGERSTEPGRGFGERPTEPGRGIGERPTEPGRSLGERPTEPGAEFGERATEPGRSTGETPSPAQTTRLRPIEDIAEAQRLRNEYALGEHNAGWSESFNPQTYRQHWHEAGGVGEPPPAFIEPGGLLRFDTSRTGVIPGDILAEGTRRRVANRPTPERAPEPAPARLLNEIYDVDTARQLIRDWEARDVPVMRIRSNRAMQSSWERAGGEGEAPVAYTNSAGGLVVNMEALGGS